MHTEQYEINTESLCYTLPHHSVYDKCTNVWNYINLSHFCHNSLGEDNSFRNTEKKENLKENFATETTERKKNPLTLVCFCAH